jgi:uncharacterized protein (TIGR00304 family)
MNKYHILSILCFLFGAIFIGLGISRGEGTIYWAVIIPIFTGSGWLFGLGSLLLILGFILLFIGFVAGSFELVSLDLEGYGWPEPKPGERRKYEQPSQKTAQRTGKKGTRTSSTPRPESGRPRSSISTGGVVFVGPIPIIWGSDKKIAYIMALVSVVLVVIFLIFTLAWVYL